MDPDADRRGIPVYLLVTWTVSSLFYFLIIKSAGTNAASGAYTTGLMWCPACFDVLDLDGLGCVVEDGVCHPRFDGRGRSRIDEQFD